MGGDYVSRSIERLLRPFASMAQDKKSDRGRIRQEKGKGRERVVVGRSVPGPESDEHPNLGSAGAGTGQSRILFVEGGGGGGGRGGG